MTRRAAVQGAGDSLRATPLLLLAALGLLTAPTAVAGADSCAYGSDAPDYFAAASPIARGVYCTGTLDLTDSQDWYYVDIADNEISSSISVTICPTSFWDPDLYVYYESGLRVAGIGGGLRPAGSSIALAGECDSVSASASALEFPGGGRWYIQVVRYDGGGTYDMYVS